VAARRSAEASTRLQRYLDETGTSTVWLADQIGVNKSSVSRWCAGLGPMTQHHREAVLETLRRRAEMPLEGLLDDQKESPPLGRYGKRYATREEQVAARSRSRATGGNHEGGGCPASPYDLEAEGQ
jgi:hypothetical protein